MEVAPHIDFIGAPVTSVSSIITITELLSALSFFALYFFISTEPSKLKTWSFYISILPVFPFVFWVLNFWTDYKMHILWFSGGNLLLFGAFWFSDWSMRDTASEILTLNDYRYSFKKV